MGSEEKNLHDEQSQNMESGARRASIGMVVVVVMLFLAIIAVTEVLAARVGNMISNVALALFTAVLFIIFYRREIKAFFDQRFGSGAKDELPMENYGNTEEYYKEHYSEYRDNAED